jgi:hypothetical protein
MFNFTDPALMRVDGDEQPTRVISTERNDTSKITDAEMRAASLAAARELAMVPFSELSKEEKASMTQAEKKAYITAAREEEKRLAAEERAASDPMFDFTNRPDAPADPSGNFINYYSWIGGVTNGEWRLYRAANTPGNQEKYGSRAIGGETQATPDSIVGANSLVVQPQPTKDEEGNLTWSVPDSVDTAGTATTDTNANNNLTPLQKAAAEAAAKAGEAGEYAKKVREAYDRFIAGTATDEDYGLLKIPKPNKGGGTATGGTATGGTATGGTATGGGGITQADVDTAIRQALAEQAAKTAAEKREQKAAEDAAKLAVKVKASDRLSAMFEGYGLGTLAGFISRRILADVSEDMLMLELYDQPEYQLRFPGMKALRDKGKTITEAEYIKDEKAFAQTARFFDVPVGFYDTPDDFGKLIGNLVSPKEFQDRLQVGQDLARSMSPGIRTQLQELYNVGEGGITAYVLDADRALPLIQKQAKAAQFVGIGREKGFKLEGMTAAQAEQIVGTEAYSKLTAQQMQTALGQAAQLRQTQSRLTGIEGQVYNEGEALKAVIESSPEAILASQQRAQREGARFGGSTGLTGASLRSTPGI